MGSMPPTVGSAAGRAPQGAEGVERDLLARTAQRDLRSFEALYKLYHPRLARFVLNLTRRHALVEEAVNDTMVVVWNKAAGFHGRSRVSTWIFSIAYRKALKALRRWDEPLPDPADERAAPERDPETRLSDGQARESLSAAIRGLSKDHRAVVELAYFHEFGYREIAEIMGCPVDTVKTRMFHARRNLRARLAGTLSDWL